METALRLMISCVVAAGGALALGPVAAQVEHSSLIMPHAAANASPTPHAASPPIAAGAAVAAAVQSSSGFEAYKNWLASRARREGVREATIQATIPSLDLNNRVIELDRGQPGGSPGSSYIPPFAPYRDRHVTRSMISRGQDRYSQHYARLQRVQARFGVDPAVVMAIYGHETSYGAVTGSFDLLEALATLAYEGRRRPLFEGEFIAALKLMDQGVPRRWLKGSYAGATGYAQFMPSTALRLRADGDGDGYADLWGSEDDAFASIANYLRDAGWKAGVPWGTPVRVSPALNRAAIRSTLVPVRCPAVYRRHSRWLTVREWRALGVQIVGQRLPETEMATLIEPDGPNATAYLLTNNYRAILDYNCSNFYALSVGVLADAIARR
jgi:lytic murein transglycosylase